MPTSLYMPDVEVHIAFNAGYTTPAASRTWTDVSAYVELADRIQIAFGRQNERSTADANTLALALDNSDGRFTAGRAASPYSPNVKIGRPIRVRVTPPGGSVVTRFVGFIDEWPVEWEDTDAYAKATIRATSRRSRLGLTAKLKSMPEQAILASRPVRYWTLGDPSGSTSASESSGNAGPPLIPFDNVNNPLVDAPVVFGNATGPATDGLTAAEFTGGDPDNAPANGLQLIGDEDLGVPRGIRFSIRVVAVGTSDWNIVTIQTTQIGPGSQGNVVLNLKTTGVIAAGIASSSLTLTGPDINDGLTHDVALVWDATTAYLVVDGVQVASASATTFPTGTITRVTYGILFTGVMAHAALWDTSNPPTVAQVQAQAAVMSASAAVERTDQRLARILGWAGVASSEITTETGVQTMTYQKTSGQSYVDALLDVESTESGVLYDRADGNVGFHNRSHRYLATAVATLNMAAQHVGADYSPKLDRSALANDATVTNPTTEETARSANASSSAEYGVATTSATSVADTYDPLQQKANWLVASYAEPRTRVPSLTVNVLAHQGLTPSAQTLLGITLGDILAVTNAPTQADTTTPSYFVEGYTEDIGPESYSLTFNLSPTYPSLNTFVLQDATRGQLNSTYVLAL